MPRVLRDLVIAHTNDFETEKQEAIKRWVEANGGCFSRTVTPDVTHLIASRRAWKRYSEPVKKARKQKSHIVKYAWLVESLSPLKPKRLDEGKYSWEQKLYKKAKRGQRLQRRNRLKCSVFEHESCDNLQDVSGSKDVIGDGSEKQIGRTSRQLNKLCNQFKKEMAVAGYHLYTDDTGFTYVTNLIRQDLREGEVEQYQLQIYESDARPCAYAVSILYIKQRGLKPPTKVDQLLVPKGSPFDFAFQAFRQFFEKKCELSWEKRMSVIAGVEANQPVDESSDALGTHRPFFYLPPKLSLQS